ncbi:hypothetical protein C8Q76DRAFT_417731 [Earliella scabrosa]|nr:hypothetical protein C8Q76DRAFT_417731 [Earliella scabrosa]
MATASSTPGPITPATEDDEGAGVLSDEGNSEELEEKVGEGGGPARRRDGDAATAVAHGWWEKWARSGSSSQSSSSSVARARRGSTNSSSRDRVAQAQAQHPPPVEPGGHLRRRETTMTPDGRQRPAPRPYSAPQASKTRRPPPFPQEDLRAAGSLRRSLMFPAAAAEAEDGRTTSRGGTGARRPGSAGGEVSTRNSNSNSNRERLERFRWTGGCR